MLYVNPLTNNRPLHMSKVESPERRKQALEEFEHLLAFQLLKEMRKTVPKNELVGSSPEFEYYNELMDDFMAGQMAKSGQLGVAKMMEEQLMRASTALPATGTTNAAEMLQLGGSRLPSNLPINTPAAMVQTLPRAES